ncbi:glycosyltransferase [Chryseolinea lacunae]|uniref:Glycosyltransferase n=1 Tax=Chryseolinea lacunae TaxID=2801331 RepID=A0ABS1KRQ6_9BACT|nr:glycosyltransferase [Chryseolinea lacunae]MBL0741352.1 glycosyltransferase [Chryseolinea lacunae]
MATVIFIAFALYTALVLALLAGWRKAIREKPPVQVGEQPLVTVVIAVRNEAPNIARLWRDLEAQRYAKLEVIFVDDHSEDETLTALASCHSEVISIKILKNTGVGKKAALTLGVQSAQGTLVATTDADCSLPPAWIETLVAAASAQGIHMVFGGVRIEPHHYFSSLQSLEFVSLIGSGAATLALGAPTMCNGANLAFRKQAFDAVGGYSGNLHIPSGDDEFLLRKIAHAFPGGVAFVRDPHGVVSTLPSPSLHSFVQQRIRWAGKWRHHQSFVSKALAAFIAVFQCLVFLLPVLAFWGVLSPTVALVLWSAKALVEYGFLRSVSAFLRLSWRWPAFLSLLVVYPLYILTIGMISNFHSFEWKGRKLKSLTVSHISTK